MLPSPHCVKKGRPAHTAPSTRVELTPSALDPDASPSSCTSRDGIRPPGRQPLILDRNVVVALNDRADSGWELDAKWSADHYARYRTWTLPTSGPAGGGRASPPDVVDRVLLNAASSYPRSPEAYPPTIPRSYPNPPRHPLGGSLGPHIGGAGAIPFEDHLAGPSGEPFRPRFCPPFIRRSYATVCRS